MGEVLLRWLADPNVAYLLFVLGLLGIVAEIVTPGPFVPGLVGAICLVLSLVGFGHLPTNWAGAGLILAAVIMFLLDIKVPGHYLSIGGIAIFVVGSLLLFTPFWLVPSAQGRAYLNPWVTLATTVGVGAFFTLGVAAGLRAQKAPLAVGRETLIGKIGVVREALAPTGIVHLEGEEWSARATCAEPIPSGRRVRVVGIAGLELEVEPVPADLVDLDLPGIGLG